MQLTEKRNSVIHRRVLHHLRKCVRIQEVASVVLIAANNRLRHLGSTHKRRIVFLAFLSWSMITTCTDQEYLLGIALPLACFLFLKLCSAADIFQTYQ